MKRIHVVGTAGTKSEKPAVLADAIAVTGAATGTAVAAVKAFRDIAT